MIEKFLAGLTEKVVEFSEKGIKSFNGDIVDFLKSSKLQTLDDLQKNATNEPKKKDQNTSLNKREYEERKAQTKIKKQGKIKG